MVKLKESYYILLSLRQPFCPSEFALVANIITDTINDLLEDDNWDHRKIYSKLAESVPTEKYLDEKIPYHAAREMSVNIKPHRNGKADVYVDDIITVAVNRNDNLHRIVRAPITVIHAVVDNANIKSNWVRRKDMITDDKMETEGAAEEEKICLGWILNTRSLLVRLPVHKSIAWKSQIQSLLSKNSVSNIDL